MGAGASSASCSAASPPDCCTAPPATCWSCRRQPVRSTGVWRLRTGRQAPTSFSPPPAGPEAMSVESGRRWQGRLLPAVALGGLIAGGLAWLAGGAGLAAILWAITTVVVLAPLAFTVALDLRRGELGVDLIALLAMAGSLALGQFLAGAVIALMLAGGQALEAFAGARARRDLTAL